MKLDSGESVRLNTKSPHYLSKSVAKKRLSNRELARLTEGSGGVQLSRGQVGSGEVSALVVVVLHVERAQFGEVDPQRAAAVVDVLTVQRLKDRTAATCQGWGKEKTRTRPAFHTVMCASVHVTHSLGVMGVHGVAELQQSLELIVSGEGDDLQHGAELTEDLKTTT